VSFGQWETASMKRDITAPSQLLVEGRTPEIFFRELVEQLGLTAGINVRTFGDVAKDTLQTYLEIFTQRAVFKEKVSRLAIIRDAEAITAAGAFQSVCSALISANVVAPTIIGQFTQPPLCVGVFILPDCSRPGMLETLCLEAAAECEANSQTKLLPCVDEFFRCVGTATTFDNPTKARFAAYALARGVVDPQLGRAAQKRIIPCKANVFIPLVEFLKQLAG
jgi:hypothetical protein